MARPEDDRTVDDDDGRSFEGFGGRKANRELRIQDRAQSNLGRQIDWRPDQTEKDQDGGDDSIDDPDTS